MEFLGSNCKPVTVSEKQVSDYVNKPSKAKFINLLTADFTLYAHKVANKRDNARSKGFEFGINTLVEILEVINKTSGVCGYTGQLFPDPNSITFERIDPNLGYTVDNTIFCTTASNNLKSNLDAFEKGDAIPDEMKVKLLYKTIYRLNKRIKAGQNG